MRSIIIAAVFAAFAVTPAFAAQDGTEGATSTGSVTVSATISEPPPIIALITGLADLNLGDVTGATTPIPVFDEICIYHTSPTISIQVVPPAGAYQLTSPTSGGVLPIAFAVFQDGLGLVAGGQGEIFASGSGIVANRESPTCATGPTQLVRAAAVSPVTAPPGAYTGTFQIIVAVE